MAFPVLPAVLDLIGRDEDELDDCVAPAIMQGGSYYLEFQVKDEIGDPFDLGPTGNPEWDVAAELRGDYLDSDPDADGEFVAEVVDGPTGWLRLKLTPGQTALLREQGNPRWDCFLTNKAVGGNSGYDAGFSQMAGRGKWALILRATENV